jgi:hypothetical protein
VKRSGTTEKGDNPWETKARRIRIKVRNRKPPDKTKKQKISWPSNRKEKLDRKL